MLLMIKSYTNQEGDDVYFECLIVSNPTATRLEWYHRVSTEQQDDHQKKERKKDDHDQNQNQDDRLHPNTSGSGGILLSNQSLVIQVEIFD